MSSPDYLNCEIHKDYHCYFYCDHPNCKKFICASCLCKAHFSHNAYYIKYVLTEQKEQLISEIEKIEKKIDEKIEKSDNVLVSKKSDLLSDLQELVFNSKTISSLRKQLKEYKERNAELLHKNKELTSEKQKNESSNQTIIQKFEEEIKTRNLENIELQGKLTKAEQSFKDEKAKLIDDYERKISDLNDKNLIDSEQNKSKLRKLEEEMKSYIDAKTVQQKLQSEVELWRQKYDNLYMQYDISKFDSEKKKAIEIESLKNKYKNKEKDFKDLAMNEARKDIGQTELNIHSQYKELLDDMFVQKNEVDYLKNKQNKVSEENKQYKVNIALSAERVEYYAKRQAEMNRALKALKAEVVLQKQALKQAAKDYEKEKELSKHRYETRIGELEHEINTLGENIKTKSKELKNIKGMAQVILDQRTDLETFFLEALEQIREEARRKRIEDQKNGIKKDENSKPQYGDKVDLSDLDWEDRERILRMLFSKMNAGVPPPMWREVKFPSIEPKPKPLQIENKMI